MRPANHLRAIVPCPSSPHRGSARQTPLLTGCVAAPSASDTTVDDGLPDSSFFPTCCPDGSPAGAVQRTIRSLQALARPGSETNLAGLASFTAASLADMTPLDRSAVVLALMIHVRLGIIPSYVHCLIPVGFRKWSPHPTPNVPEGSPRPSPIVESSPDGGRLLAAHRCSSCGKSRPP